MLWLQENYIAVKGRDNPLTDIEMMMDEGPVYVHTNGHVHHAPIILTDDDGRIVPMSEFNDDEPPHQTNLTKDSTILWGTPYCLFRFVRVSVSVSVFLSVSICVSVLCLTDKSISKFLRVFLSVRLSIICFLCFYLSLCILFCFFIPDKRDRQTHRKTDRQTNSESVTTEFAMAWRCSAEACIHGVKCVRRRSLSLNNKNPRLIFKLTRTR